MWFLGHLALGYFSGYAASKYSKQELMIPLVWVFSLMPDLDEFFRRYMVHRGPAHSIIVAIMIFIPIFILFKKKALPYFAALASHSLIGDYFVPPTQLFWPLSNAWFGVSPEFQLTGMTETMVEVLLFSLMGIMILYRRKLFVDSPGSKNNVR